MVGHYNTRFEELKGFLKNLFLNWKIAKDPNGDPILDEEVTRLPAHVIA
jgi:hypothetical protein